MSCCNKCKAIGFPGKFTTPWCGKMGNCDCHQPTKEECCGKCKYFDHPIKGQGGFCSDFNCECHSPSKDSTVGWEEEFDEKDRKGEFGLSDGQGYGMDADAVKTFIRSTLSSQLEEVKVKINGMRRTDDTQMSHDHAHDEALDDVLKLLDSFNKEK